MNLKRKILVAQIGKYILCSFSKQAEPENGSLVMKSSLDPRPSLIFVSHVFPFCAHTCHHPTLTPMLICIKRFKIVSADAEVRHPGLLRGIVLCKC